MKNLSRIAILALFLVVSGVLNAQQNGSAAGARDFIQGPVASIRPQVRLITLRRASYGDNLEFVIADEVQITIAGEEARPRDVRRGDIVRLTLVDDAEIPTVATIDIPESETTIEERRANAPSAPAGVNAPPRREETPNIVEAEMNVADQETVAAPDAPASALSGSAAGIEPGGDVDTGNASQIIVLSFIALSVLLSGLWIFRRPRKGA